MKSALRLWTIFLLVVFFIPALSCVRGEMDDRDTIEEFDNPGGDGPVVLFEPDAEPVSLLPQPNNILARKDDSTSTGLRVNIPLEGETDFVLSMRRSLRDLDGFANFANITASFSLRLDLDTVRGDRHWDDTERDATIFVVNVQRDSPFYGEILSLDLNRGYFPKDMKNKEALFPNDKFADAKDLIYDPSNRFDHYEDATNTLIIRTMRPLRQQHKYAVVFTTGLRGENGFPVRPPEYFDSITFPGQEDSLSDASAILRANRGLDSEDIAFSWEFTTMSISEPLETLRRGLYGEGPFAWMADELRPEITMLHNFSVEGEDDNNDQTFDAGRFAELIDTIVSIIPEADSLPIDVILSMNHLDYIVSGSYTTLSFLDNEDRLFHWDYKEGIIDYRPEEVTFYISVPKPTKTNGYAQPPYPVVFYQHANIRNRLDSVIMADKFAEQGLAVIGIDAAEHGPETYISGALYILESLADADLGQVSNIPVVIIAKLILAVFYPSIDTRGMTAAQMVDVLKNDTFMGAMMHGRAVDVNNDNLLISGQSFYTANIFRTVDITRQTIFDLFEGVRMVHALCEDADGDGKLGMLEGDFNRDGVCDVGGRDENGEYLPVYFMGMSLGSLMGVAFVALEPYIETAVFNVPGGGLTDILMRTTVPNVNAAIRAELTGPVVVGRKDPNAARVLLTYNVEPLSLSFGSVDYRPGARVVLQNLDGGAVSEDVMDQEGNFAVAVGADVGDVLRLKLVDPESGAMLDEMEWPTRIKGLGVTRNTPKARSFIDMAQWGVSLTDAIGFAPHLYLDPLPGNKPKNFLMQICSPDAAVPMSAGVAVIRAAGIIDTAHQENLLAAGALNWDRISFGNGNLPIQSYSGRGWRLHPAYNHEYLLAPRDDPYSIMYSIAARRQAALFLKSDGAIIEDNLYFLVEDKYLADPIDPDTIE